MTYDVIIIGAGAAGLYCGAHLENKKVLMIERNGKLGVKILASGGGQCNLTHGGYMNAFYSKYGENKKFVKNILKGHDNKAVMDFFEKRGCPLTERDDGKVFPSSLRASDVVKTLEKSNQEVEIHLCELVKEVEWVNHEYVVTTDHAVYRAFNLVISTGGKSYPSLGSTGDGFKFAAKFGHHIVEPKPGLTGIVTKDKRLTSLQGVAIEEVKITLLKNDKSTLFSGPLLFTHFGMSGPVILNNSRYMDRGDQLLVNFINQPPQLVETQLLEIIKVSGDKPVAFWLNQIGLTEALKRILFQEDEQLKTQKLATLTKMQRKDLVKKLTEYPIEIESLIGYQNAMVTVGGIDLNEVDSLTLMSNRINHLYFCGEVLDVDGDTGGYNLQWAFSSGFTVAKAIKNDIITRGTI